MMLAAGEHFSSNTTTEGRLHRPVNRIEEEIILVSVRWVNQIASSGHLPGSRRRCRAIMVNFYYGRWMRVIVPAAVMASAAFSALAVTDFSFRGVFRCDADVAHVVFTLNDPSRVTRRTCGYGGGKQADGKPVRPGGFDPALVLWDSNGDLLDQWDDGPDPVRQDPDTLFRSDVNESLNLDAGNYRVSLVQWFNGAAGSNLADGFTETSDTFTSVLLCPRGHFSNISEDNRRRTWAFDVLGVDSAKLVGPAVVPLPATLPLLLAALAGVGAVARRRP